MSAAAVACLVLVGGFVWGGFVFLAVKAARCEAVKRGSVESGPAGD